MTTPERLYSGAEYTYFGLNTRIHTKYMYFGLNTHKIHVFCIQLSAPIKKQDF